MGPSVLSEFLDQVKSFALARVLITAIELDVFQELQQASLTRDDLRQRLGIADTPISDAFLDVLVAFEVLAEGSGKLSLTPTGRSVLPVYESIRSWSREMQLFYHSLDDLTGLLKCGCYRDTALSHYWVYKRSPDRKQLQLPAVDDYSSVMDASQTQLSQAIMEHYDFGVHEHIMDVGGGYGRLAISLADRYPGLKITITDLPAVCEGASARIDAAGLGERITCLPVDFFRDDLPTNVVDAIVFVRVLHDWDDHEVADLIMKTRACLRGPGVALVVEPMTDESVETNRSSVLSSLMLTLAGGRRRSVQQYVKLLSSAGYARLSWSDCGLSIYKMVVARI